MAFVTYENRRNPHVTIHLEGCTQIRKRGGEHVTGRASTMITSRFPTRALRTADWAANDRMLVLQADRATRVQCVDGRADSDASACQAGHRFHAESIGRYNGSSPQSAREGCHGCYQTYPR